MCRICLFLSCFFLFLFVGCESSEEQCPFLSDTYHLYVLFEDESGANPMLDLDLEEEPDPEIEFSEYYKILAQPQSYFIRLEGAYSCPDRGGLYNPKELGYTWLDGKAYANFNLLKTGDVLPDLGIYVRCEKLFGHNEEHVIKVEFAKVSKENHRVDCVRFTFDGVEYPVSEGGRVTVPISRN